MVPLPDVEGVLGDLAEEWFERVAAGRPARLWYWRQAVGCVARGAAQQWRSGRRQRRQRRTNGSDGAMMQLLQELRYGVRSIRRNPLFSLVVACTLGLGIAANTVVFSAVDGVVLNPFPFPEPDRLVGVGTAYPRIGAELAFWENLSPAEYRDIAENSRTLEHVVAWDMGNRQVTFGETTENVFSGFWFDDAFPTLGMAPVAGRGFTREELDRGDRVAVLSDRVWQGRFGGDPSLVGGTILVNGDPYTVIGIMPERGQIYGMDLWIPLGASPTAFPRNRRQMQVLARIAEGETLSSVNAELATIAGRVATEFGSEFEEYEGWELRAVTWNEINVRALRPAALVLLGAVVFVLLLVCANVASLLLARGASRHREIAVRSALGAGRGRLLGQLLAESVILALAGGVIGVAIGWAGTSVVSDVVGSLALPIPGQIGINGRVLGFTALVSIAAGLAFGAVPAFHVSRTDLQRTLQAESNAVSGSRGAMRLQRAFVGIEVALALALLAGAGLLVSSFLNLGRVQPGFDSSNVLTMRLTLAWERYDPDGIEPFFQELREQVSAIPGVVAVGTTSQFPPGVFSRNQLLIEGAPTQSEAAIPVAYTTLISPGYFDAMRMTVLRGRGLTEADRATSPWVAVIDETAARRYFPDTDPIGQRIRIDADAPWMEIVGVTAATQNTGLDREPQPELFGSSVQMGGLSNQMFLVVRTSVAPRSVLPAVREAVVSIDPEQPVYLIRTLEEALAQTQATRRLSMYSLGILALFALLLAAVGIYGVVAYAVSRRTREIGVRMALGAARSQVLGLVVRQALLPVAIGAGVGIAAAVATGRLMSSLLFGVSGGDPVTLIASAAVLGTAALLASWLPARRAVALDPVQALRPK
jgi:predicted permease